MKLLTFFSFITLFFISNINANEFNWEDECVYLESEDECLEAGCMYDPERGCYKDFDEEEDWENDVGFPGV